jgi:hypothetical protein
MQRRRTHQLVPCGFYSKSSVAETEMSIKENSKSPISGSRKISHHHQLLQSKGGYLYILLHRTFYMGKLSWNGDEL